MLKAGFSRGILNNYVIGAIIAAMRAELTTFGRPTARTDGDDARTGTASKEDCGTRAKPGESFGLSG
jgi:hypothetical protein